jgi:hypothetical protein
MIFSIVNHISPVFCFFLFSFHLIGSFSINAITSFTKPLTTIHKF